MKLLYLCVIPVVSIIMKWYLLVKSANECNRMLKYNIFIFRVTGVGIFATYVSRDALRTARSIIFIYSVVFLLPARSPYLLLFWK
jgi:hypothetical protein